MKLAKFGFIAAALLFAGNVLAMPITQSFGVHANNNVWNEGLGASNTPTGDPGLATGINFSVGDIFSVSVDNPNDTWFFCGGGGCEVDADGRRVSNGTFFGVYTHSGFSENHGALVGRVGTGAFFEIGTAGFNGPSNANGELRLYHWDHNNNNFGTIAASVTFTPASASTTAPEPGVVAMLGLGLVGASIAARRRRA